MYISRGKGNWLGDGAGQWTDEYGPGDGKTDNQTDTKADPQNRQRTKIMHTMLV